MRNRLRHDQSGIAVPVVMMALLISLVLVAAAATRSQGTADTALRDLNAKRALQAAESGLRQAVYRTNAASFDLSFILNGGITQQCLVRVGGELTNAPIVGTLLGGRTWCATVTEDLGNGAGYDYRVSNTVTVSVSGLNRVLNKRVVVTGRSGFGSRVVSRRMAADVEATATVDISSLLTNDAQLRLFQVKADSIHECRGPIPAAGADPWTGC